MSVSETGICNMALARLGASRINDFDTDDSVNGVHCREHYEPTRDALLRSHWWRFARARATLSADATAPDFGYDHQYILPADCLRVRGLYDTTGTWEVEGQRLLTDDDTAELFYIRRVTDPAQFDSMFVKVLVLYLALELVMPISQSAQLYQVIEGQYERALARARTVNLQEQRKTGDDDKDIWNDERF